MHPILARRSRLALYLAAWLVLGGLLAGVLAVAEGTGWEAALALALPLALLYAFICLAAWYPCRATPLGVAGTPRVLATQAVAAVLSSGLWLLLGTAWSSALARLGPFAGLVDVYRGRQPLFFTVGVLLYLLAAAFHYLLITFEESRQSEARALELRVLAREAELRALRAQVDPHFLFNCLNSIAALTGGDPPAARRMALRLADFLRASLRAGGEAEITLDEELALASTYLAIERVRFGDRLEVEERIEAASRGCLLPPLLLQPLVENAVTHGIAHLLAGGTVAISARLHGDRLELAVENPCDPERLRPAAGGIGLANVRRRLEVAYGREARLEVGVTAERFRAEVVLPARPAAGAAPAGGGDGAS